MANPVVHWEVSGKDQKKLQEFYAALFEWKVNVQEEMGGYGLVEEQEGGIGGGISETQPGASPSVTFYVQAAYAGRTPTHCRRLGPAYRCAAERAN